MTTEPKLTEWFPPTTKPTEIKIYETKIPQIHGFSFWNGKEWLDTQFCIEDCNKDNVKGIQEKTWRGLAENPENKK